MPTEKQSAASRANSQKSTGPRTPEGRAKSRFNALKHGIFAESQIIFTESAEDLAELAAEYHEHYNPADPAERCLVDALIETEWRIRRMRRVEAGMWEDKRSSLLRHKTIWEDDPSKRAVTTGEVFYSDDAKFASLQRVVSSCHRDYRGDLKELVARGHARRTRQPEESESPVEQALPPDSPTVIPACPPTTDTPVPQPEESTTTSESPASFPNNSANAPEPPSAGPETPPNPAPAPGPTPILAADRIPTLPEAA